MKRITLLGLLVITSSGCGFGWLPFRPFRGAPCRMGSPCVGAAPVAGCGVTAGYPSYEGSYEGAIVEGEVLGGSGYYGGEIIHDGISGSNFQGRSTIVAPPMQTLPSAPVRSN